MNTDEAVQKLQEECDRLGFPFRLNWEYDNDCQLVIYTDAYLKDGQWVKSEEMPSREEW